MGSTSILWGVQKEITMTILITLFVILFLLAGISPLLVTEDVKDIVAIGE